jgi:hypothetical protein
MPPHWHFLVRKPITILTYCLLQLNYSVTDFPLIPKPLLFSFDHHRNGSSNVCPEIPTLLADSKPVANEVRNANFNTATDLHIIGGKLVFFAEQVLFCLINFPTCINPPVHSRRPRLFYDSPHVSFSHPD